MSEPLAMSTPWLIDETAWPRVESVLQAAAKYPLQNPEPQASDYRCDTSKPPDSSPREYDVINGIAVISIKGVLVKRSEWYLRYLGMVSSDEICEQVACAISDPYVKRIVFDVDTPGGEVCGTADCADVIFEARSKKPSTAVANDYCCSSGLWIATAAGEFVVTQSAWVGSIGVYQVRYDYSEAQKKAGIGVTVIRAGREKAYGLPSLPMTADEMKVRQAAVDDLYELFVAAIARNRATSPEHVLKEWADARCFRGPAAVAIDLADRVSTLDRVLADFGADANSLTDNDDEEQEDGQGRTDPDTDESPNASGTSGSSCSSSRPRIWPRLSRPFRRR